MVALIVNSFIETIPCDLNGIKCNGLVFIGSHNMYRKGPALQSDDLYNGGMEEQNDWIIYHP